MKKKRSPKGLSVLLIEDDPVLRKLVRAYLKKLEFGQVYSTDNAVSALGHLLKETVDLVIVDWEMSILDGRDFTRIVRRDVEMDQVRLPIIMITAHNSRRRLLDAKNAGVSSFLSKPFSGDQLSKHIIGVLNDPRDFIVAEGYVGPDRRTKDSEDFFGDERRSGE